MKLVTFRRNSGPPRSGVLIDDGAAVIDLALAHRAHWEKDDAPFASVLDIVEAGANGLDIVAEILKRPSVSAVGRMARTEVSLDAPIPRPPQMRDFLCFEKHLVQAFEQARRVRAREAADPEAAMREMEQKGILSIPAVWYERPIFYHPNRLNVIGTETDVVWPRYSQLMDFELEFGCYIGTSGRDIAARDARPHIFGYTIFNDFSARDEQTREMPGQLGPGKGKDFDGGNAMGPCLVTADEIKNPYDLTMIARVNGEEWARGNTGEMHWKFEDCIAHVSRGETLHPGEFFGSGTVGGGCGLETLRFLKSGDVVELEVEGIGILRNRVLRND
jgi:2-keto-4-pentenoate hydratase/2-oxohepta-3-ene-1,7-dioic acid hydratase in catechol pathway